MRNDLVYIGAVIALAGAVPYVFNTIRGKTHPNIVTWFTWMLLNSISAAAAWSSGAHQTTVFSLAGAIATGSIVVVGLKYGVKKYTLFDISCQAVAIMGLILWQVSARPVIAILCNLGADFAGYLPTYRHAWQSPYAETWQTFVFSGTAAIFTLAAIQHYTFIALAFPTYILTANIVLTTTILLRRQSVAEVTASER